MILIWLDKQRNAYLYAFLCFIFQSATAQVRLPRLVSDSMILQRDSRIRVWGWASPGEKVAIHFHGQAPVATTGTDGKWTAWLSPMPQGGPFDMQIDATNHITLKNILLGDIWVCSGQSNMELPMERVKEKYADVIDHCANPFIRQFSVATRYVFTHPPDDLSSGAWQSTTPSSVLSFSAVGYFFAKALYDRYRVPIGLIKAAVGGSPAEAWLSGDALKDFPQYLSLAHQFANSAYSDSIRQKDNAISNEWYDHLWRQDSGLHGKSPWYSPGYDAAAWKEMPVPGYWADQGEGPVNGVVWFRKAVEVPASMTGKPVKLMLGRIVDRDSVYVNGTFVGTIGYQYPPRRYEIPAGVLKPGKNLVVVRVINSSGRGGFVPDKPYWLGQENMRISLEGKWKYRVGAVMPPLPGSTFFQYQPMGLYNGVIAALLPLAIKGVIWYQGEANTGKAFEYRSLFPALIADWRKQWGQGNFPFLYVQLANFMETRSQPSESNWAQLREAQLLSLSVPRTAMVVTADLGEWNDIHPLDKADVGKRLALAARKLCYGEEKLTASGPLYQSMKKEGNRIHLRFTSTGSGLVVKGGGTLKYFSLAGQDKHFVWAHAVIKGDEVIVWSDEVPAPIVVRYAWADNPREANLYNKEGLPASPFTTAP